MFAGLSGQIGQTAAALVAQGKDGAQVLSAMRGPLQTMWELEKKFGYTTDEATQKLIDQAEAQGLVGEKFKPIGEQMLDATNRIAAAVEGLAEVFGVLPKAAKDAAGGMSEELGKIKIPSITIPVGFLKGGETGADDYPYHLHTDNGGAQAAGGDYTVTRPTLFLAGEAGAERATFTPISQKTQTSAGSATPAPNPPAGDTTYQISITGFNGTDILRTVRSSEFVQALVSATAQNKNGLGTGLKGALQVTP
jgi:hypothetical protein